MYHRVAPQPRLQSQNLGFHHPWDNCTIKGLPCLLITLKFRIIKNTLYSHTIHEVQVLRTAHSLTRHSQSSGWLTLKSIKSSPVSALLCTALYNTLACIYMDISFGKFPSPVFLIYSLCVCVFCLHGWVCTKCVLDILRVSSEKGIRSLEQEVQMAVNTLWGLGTPLQNLFCKSS